MASGYSVANLGITITSSANTAIRSVNSLTNALMKSNQEAYKLAGTMGILNGKVVSTVASTNNYNNSIKGISTNANTANNSLMKMSGTMNNFGRILATSIGFGSLQQGLQTVIRIGKSALTEATNFIENYNLFNVSMKTSFGKDLKTQEEIANAFQKQVDFQNELNRSFLTNQSETMRYQGFFQNLSSSLGISSQGAAILSQNLTKLTYDLSSLYNVPVDAIYSKLQSGIIGQTKPLRTLGIDVTMQTLQPILTEMGIDRQVTSLTQAEKVMLRYISILRQSTSAQGDFARTIETPANQMKIFSAQLSELTRWFGTLFIGVFGQILPYINAVVIGLKEIFKAMSLAFGFDVNQYDFLAQQEDLANGFEDALDGATNSSEKLKKSLFGFDEINNLSSSTTSGIGSIGGIYDSGVYEQLEKMLVSYNNGMEGIKTKAIEIKEQLFSWLGIFEDNHGKLILLEGAFGGVFDDLKELDFTGISDGLTKVWDAISPFTKTVVDNLILFYKDYIKPMADVVVEDTLPDFLDFMATAIDTLRIAIETSFPFWKDFIDYVLLPLSKISLAAFNFTLSVLVFLMKELSKLMENKTFRDMIPLFFGPAGWAYAAIKFNGNKSANDNTDFTMDGFGYADGGMPTTGQLFMAREAGPEMVGVIGGRTAVANNNQIVEAISQGVYSAMVTANSSGNLTVNVMLDDGVKLGSALIDNINTATKATGKTVLAR